MNAPIIGALVIWMLVLTFTTASFFSRYEDMRSIAIIVNVILIVGSLLVVLIDLFPVVV